MGLDTIKRLTPLRCGRQRLNRRQIRGRVSPRRLG